VLVCLHRIDVHHHYFPPRLLSAHREARGSLPAEFKNWSVEQAVEELDRARTATAFISTSSGAELRAAHGAAGVQAIATDCNIFAAGMARDYPGRFGFFAFLPMPDVEASLREMTFALDDLGADGVGFMTSYGNQWLGDAAFLPLLEELDRRNCIAYVHPLLPDCCNDILSYVPRAILEFPYDTGRAILSLLFGGAFARFRNIRWIFSHSGGPLPALSGRVELLAGSHPLAPDIAPDGIAAEFRRLYCETANAATRGAMNALLEWIPQEHILFGTDYPYVSSGHNVAALHGCGFSEELVRSIEHDNACALFGRLRASAGS
jgi:predicted TIM-barrel fold metal-dependent hydrolase